MIECAIIGSDTQVPALVDNPPPPTLRALAISETRDLFSRHNHINLDSRAGGRRQRHRNQHAFRRTYTARVGVPGQLYGHTNPPSTQSTTHLSIRPPTYHILIRRRYSPRVRPGISRHYADHGRRHFHVPTYPQPRHEIPGGIGLQPDRHPDNLLFDKPVRAFITLRMY